MEKTTSPASVPAPISASEEQQAKQAEPLPIGINWIAVLTGVFGAVAVVLFGVLFYLPLKTQSDQLEDDNDTLQSQLDECAADCDCPDGDGEGDEGDGNGGAGCDCDCDSDDVDGDDDGALPDECSVELTAEEEPIVADWNTYTFGPAGLTFRLPADLNVLMEGGAGMMASDLGEAYTLYVALEVAGPRGANPDRETSQDVELWCEPATRNMKEWDMADPPEWNDMRMISTYFDAGEFEYKAVVTYTYEGASISSDIIELYNLVLKTISF